MLNNFFLDQTLIDDTNTDVPFVPSSNESNINTIVLTPSEVHDVLKSLPIGKAAGPDGICNRVLLEASNELSIPLCKLYNASLSCCKVPTDWKEAHVTAVFKKGDPSLPNNYRPISLLNTLEKVFERLIYKHIYNHLHHNNFFTPVQSGFMPGDSTINQLTFIYDNLCKALDNGLETRVVFFDISKAFDKVWHRGLLAKLKAAGITGHLLSWFHDYLTSRTQRVVLPGATSDLVYIKSGVPQGSILGPLLFLVYINDIVYGIESNINLFADDTSLYITSDNPQSAADILQSDIVRISSWADKWLVTFNPSKSESLIVSRKRSQQLHPPLIMYDRPIIEVNDHKHLGVYLSTDCSWHSHISFMTKKAWKRVNIMRKLKHVLDRKSLEIIYISFIRPLLEYADVVWSNCTHHEMEQLEKVQIESARIATGATKLVSIETLLNEIGWVPLSERRKQHRLVLFYKMFNYLTPDYLSSFFDRNNPDSRYNLRNSENVPGIPSRTTSYFNSFLPSVIRNWNALSLDIRNATSLNTFKTHLNPIMLKTPSFYYVGTRRLQILHTRLRTKCSSLNHYLFSKGVVDNPLCSCGEIETDYHYFFNCIYLTHCRTTLFESRQDFQIDLDILLFGCELPTNEQNAFIFHCVQRFILESKRF